MSWRNVGGPAPPEVQPLAWSRLALGALFVIRTTPLVDWLRFPFSIAAYPLLGWPDGRWAGTGLLTLAPSVTSALCILRTAAAILFLLGICTRPAGLAAGAAGYLVLIEQPFGFVSTIHLLYLGTMLLALTDAGSAYAVRPTRAVAPVSGVMLIRGFLASVYAWAGIAKMRPDWWDGRTLALYAADGAFPAWATRTLLATSTSRALCATSVMAVELALPFALLLPRTRNVALFAAFALHAAIELAARPDLLGWEMAALLIALWPVSSGADQGEVTQGREAAGQPMRP
jgi:hypothetical protein